MKDTINELLAELKTFPGREEGLRKIYRWKNRRPMFYRSNLYTHSKHVAWFTAEVIPVVKKEFPDFDEKRALALALVHDDAELIMGDYAAGDKAKMTPEQLAAIAKEEEESIELISKKYPQILAGYNYKELLQDIVELNTIEAQVAKYMDRIEGLGEGLHEVYAGNPHFVGTLTNTYGVTPAFDEHNVRLRTEMMKKSPALQKLKNSHVFFGFSPLQDCEQLVKNKQPFTAQSVHETVDYPEYDLWKKVILNSGDSEEIKNMYTQQEFLL